MNQSQLHHGALLQKPYRPKAIKALNAVGRFVEKFGLRIAMNADHLFRRAQRKTGLTDGLEDVREALEVLTNSIEHEANLHPFGRWVVHNRLLGLLMTRLRVHELVNANPEIRNEQINAPIVIAGLQRTGTTMLHRLLAADPDTRALASWEAISPLPDPSQKPGEPDRRIKAAEIAERGLKYLSPEFFAIHPVEAEAPEEDVLLMEYSLLSQVPEATMRLPSYSKWLAAQDMRPAYEYLKLLLQVLQSQRSAKRWVLKTPAHLEHLDQLLAVFPDAKVIQTHRDPTRTVASFASMISHGCAVFSDQINPVELAAHWHAKNASMVRRAAVVRSSNPTAFLDVYYADLIRDPMPDVQRIYDFAGIELTNDIRAAMDRSRNENRKDRHGKHSYQLEDFGLSADIVRREYADYLTQFNIPEER